jgi:4,5-DOPA dioxygenase extradiol
VSPHAIFVSHGAPTLPLEDGSARRFLAGWGERIGRPRAIVVASAHWTTDAPALSTTPAPATIHDFYGFPEALYRMRYPAPGAPDVAERAARLLADAGLPATLDPARGLDHGAWVPLLLMFPGADIPVTSLAVQPDRDPAHHRRVGEALAPLAADDVLVIGSGGATHDLRRFRGARAEAAPAPDVAAFADWLADRAEAGDVAALDDVFAAAPGARAQHPTPEHLLPFHVALGAGGGCGRRVHRSTSYGFLAMDAYEFGAA